MKTFPKVSEEFIQKWVQETAPYPEAEEHFKQIEKDLKITLPQNYKTFIQSYGEVSTQRLLSSICESEESVSDIQEFIKLTEIIKLTTMYESGGMKKGYITFASDCMGNLFLFKKSDCVNNCEDAKVYFFDHDYVTTEVEEKSFSQLLNRYSNITVIKG